MDLRPVQTTGYSRRDRLILRYLSLVAPVARQLQTRLPRQFLLEDLLSAGVEGLIQSARRFQFQCPGNLDVQFRAYAVPRIRGAILNSVRRSQYRQALSPSLDAIVEPVSAGQYQSIDQACDVARLCVGLTDEELRILRLRHWEGLQAGEAATRMGATLRTAKCLHARAMRKLRLAARTDFAPTGDYTGRVAKRTSADTSIRNRAKTVDELGALQEEIAKRQLREKELIREIRGWADADAKPGKPIVYEGRMYLAPVTAKGSRQKVTDKLKVFLMLGKEEFLDSCGFTVEKAEKVLTAEQFAAVVSVDQFCSPRTVSTVARIEVSASKKAA